MTQNRRIVLNIVATYGRSLYALVIGLFCGRWALLALGEVDYGLLGLVGGLTAFVSFFNMLLASAISRFYAVNVGAARKKGNEKAGLEECRRWFNTAFSVHSVLPVILIAVGYPAGVWAVENFLTIPPDRVMACIWVWRFTCISCFVGMFNVPFQAMYTAKQEIAELTVYSFVSTTLHFCILYYMISHPGIWLVKYAAWGCCLSFAPQLIIALRAVIKYPECKVVRAYLWDRGYFGQILKYAASRLWPEFSRIVSAQAYPIFVNKFMGPVYNASITVGNSVAAHASTLSNSLLGAFWPAIANKAGEGDFSEVKRLCFMACRIGTVMVLVFAIPLAIEINEVLHLWLKTPPRFSAMICLAALLASAIGHMTAPYWMVVLGMGRGVVAYGLIGGWAGVTGAGVALVCLLLGLGMWGVCIGMVTGTCLCVIIQILVCRKVVELSFLYWVRHVMVPVALLTSVTVVVGFFPRLFMAASFARVITTGLFCEAVFLPAIWLFVLEPSEKAFLDQKIFSRLPWRKQKEANRA